MPRTKETKVRGRAGARGTYRLWESGEATPQRLLRRRLPHPPAPSAAAAANSPPAAAASRQRRRRVIAQAEGGGKRRSREPHIHTMTSQRAASPRARKRRSKEPFEGLVPPSSPPRIGGGGGDLGNKERGRGFILASCVEIQALQLPAKCASSFPWLPWNRRTLGCVPGTRVPFCRPGCGGREVILSCVLCRLSFRTGCFYGFRIPDKIFFKTASSCCSTRF